MLRTFFFQVGPNSAVLLMLLLFRCTWKNLVLTSSALKRLWGRYIFLFFTKYLSCIQRQSDFLKTSRLPSTTSPGTTSTPPAGTPRGSWASPSPWKRKPPSSSEPLYSPRNLGNNLSRRAAIDLPDPDRSSESS